MPRTKDVRKLAEADQRAAVQLAARAVAAYFDDVMGNREFMSDGSIPANHLDAAFGEVSDILERQHVRQYGPIKDTEDLVRWTIGGEAGYLIGVQVGLRLRTTGGAR